MRPKADIAFNVYDSRFSRLLIRRAHIFEVNKTFIYLNRGASLANLSSDLELGARFVNR